MRRNILVVDDEKEVRDCIKGALREAGYTTEEAASGEEGVSKAGEHYFDVVVLDVRLGGMDGIVTYREIKKINPHMKVLFITAYYPPHLIISSIPRGTGEVCLQKPFEMGELLANVHHMCA